MMPTRIYTVKLYNAYELYTLYPSLSSSLPLSTSFFAAAAAAAAATLLFIFSSGLGQTFALGGLPNAQPGHVGPLLVE
jgi:hypothetical protein